MSSPTPHPKFLPLSSLQPTIVYLLDFSQQQLQFPPPPPLHHTQPSWQLHLTRTKQKPRLEKKRKKENWSHISLQLNNNLPFFLLSSPPYQTRLQQSCHSPLVGFTRRNTQSLTVMLWSMLSRYRLPLFPGEDGGWEMGLSGYLWWEFSDRRNGSIRQASGIRQHRRHDLAQ